MTRQDPLPINAHTWLIYLLAAVGLSLSPGPNSLLALTHGALHGRRKTLFTIFSGAFGFVVVVALSMFRSRCGNLSFLAFGLQMAMPAILIGGYPPTSIGSTASRRSGRRCWPRWPRWPCQRTRGATLNMRTIDETRPPAWAACPFP